MNILAFFSRKICQFQLIRLIVRLFGLGVGEFGFGSQFDTRCLLAKSPVGVYQPQAGVAQVAGQG